MTADSATPWREEEIRAFASIGTGARDTQDRTHGGRYPFFVRSQKVERIDSWSFDGEAVLTAGDGVGTGKIFHYIDGKFDYHQRVYRISNFRRDVSGRYFFHQFSRNFLARLESLTAKSSVDSVRMETIAGMVIPLPSRPEQEAITRAIDDADDAVTGLERLIEKKHNVKQGLMQELLTGRTRLAGFTAPWERLRVADASHLKARIGWQGLTTQEYRQSGEYRLVGGTSFRDGRVDWDRTPYVDRWRFDQDANIQLQTGDVLITKDGTIGKVATVGAMPGPATLNSGVFVLRPKRDAYVSDFLYWVLRSRVFAEFVGGLSAGSTITHLYQRDLETLELLVPPTLREQRAIAEVLTDADRDIDALERRLKSARGVKMGIMQELLTGRTRLPVEAP